MFNTAFIFQINVRSSERSDIGGTGRMIPGAAGYDIRESEYPRDAKRISESSDYADVSNPLYIKYSN